MSKSRYTIIGRSKETAKLDELRKENRSHFVAIYGRRRVGKTFLIREHFKSFSFYHTGLAAGSMNDQLIAFGYSLTKYGLELQRTPSNWLEAFHLLEKLVVKSRAKKKVIFIDELPWMDTPRANFLSAFENFWNGWASGRKDILLIVCGSATSWIVNKLFNNKGGLHNRVTRRIKLSPFNLYETELFLQNKGIIWDRYQILKAYMAFGGIPYYLELIQRGKSVDQTIDQLYFDPNGDLKTEYENLYAALFKNPERYIAVIEALSSKNKGLTRNEISELTKIKNGGHLTKILKDLELSDFIRVYSPYKRVSRQSLYQLTDAYSLFYYNFIHNKKIAKGAWLNTIDNPRYRAWSGYAYEMIWFKHPDQLKQGLGISGVYTEQSSWKEENAQIDLLIDRRDQVINVCEAKFSLGEFVIDKKYDAQLRNKLGTFKSVSKTKKSVFLCMLTTYGIKENAYSGLVQNTLTMDHLFIKSTEL